MKTSNVPADFDGCARECRKAGQHTLVWGRCGHAAEPTPPSKDDLRGLLVAARLTSHMATAADGHPAVVMHTPEEAADLALKVVQGWMFGTPEQIAQREREAAERQPDDVTVICERATPGRHEQRARERAADELEERFQRMREDGEHDMRTVLDHVREVLRGES